MRGRTLFLALAIAPLAGAEVDAQATGPARSTAADTRLLEAIDWYTGVAGRVDDDRARQLLLAASRDGADPLTRMWIARVHSRGRMGFERDEPRARQIAAQVIAEVRTLAASRDIEAQFLMGTAYDEGLGVPVDFGEAVRWYRRAARRGHVLAEHNLGNVYREGRGVATNHELAVMWWLRAARAGDAVTQLRLGEAFEAGQGVEPDLETALEWYRRSAEAGNEEARRALTRVGAR